MDNAIQMDASGRLVLPKLLRERLNLRAGARLQAEIVAGRIELTPVPGEQHQILKTKSGVTVLARTGTPTDAAAAVAAERTTLSERGLRR